MNNQEEKTNRFTFYVTYDLKDEEGNVIKELSWNIDDLVSLKEQPEDFQEIYQKERGDNDMAEFKNCYVVTYNEKRVLITPKDIETNGI